MSFPVITAGGGVGEAVLSQKVTAFLGTAERALRHLLKGWPAPAAGHTCPECAGRRRAARKGVESESGQRRLGTESVGSSSLRVFKNGMILRKI